MKTNMILLVAALITTHAFADDSSQNANIKQATSVTTVLASAQEPGMNALTANESMSKQNGGIAPTMKYTGIFYGPGMKFDDAGKQASNNISPSNYNGDIYLHNRPKFLLKSGEKIDFGIDTRFDAVFSSENVKAYNANYRLLADFKDVYKSDILALMLTPRIALPTSNRAHDQKLMMSPELVATFDYTPKNTRFSFNGGATLAYSFYQSNPTPTATTSLIQPWIEMDYQVVPNLQAMVSYYPEFTAASHNNQPLAADSQEFDVGVNWDFMKGWTLIPYVALEAYSLRDVTGPLNNMQMNLIVTGTVF